MNTELVPDLIKDLVNRYVKAKESDNRRNQNEILNLQLRLEAIQVFVAQALSK